MEDALGPSYHRAWARQFVMAELDGAKWQKFFGARSAEDAAFFDSSLQGLITAAYREAWGN